MSSRKFLIQQVVDLVIVDFEVAALDDENALFKVFTLIDLSKELL